MLSGELPFGSGTPGNADPAGHSDPTGHTDGFEPEDPPDDTEVFDSADSHVDDFESDDFESDDSETDDFDGDDLESDDFTSGGEIAREDAITDTAAGASPGSESASTFGDANPAPNPAANRTTPGSPLAHVRPNLALMVPALSLLGQSEEPAILEGYGPIDLDTAKRLVANATSLTRILTHPETGTILSVGSKKYRVPKALTTVGTSSGSDSPNTSGGATAGASPAANRTITGNPFAHIRPDVALIVPALSLLGRSDEPAVLEGSSPIDQDTAQRLVGNLTSFIRILTHPETGTVLSVGRKRYRVPRAMRRWLAFRDQTCTKPGCGAPAAYCDLDHIVEWQHGGESSVLNLAYLCPKHHAEKHHTGWRTEMTPTGTRWTSPTGKTYDSPHGMDILTG